MKLLLVIFSALFITSCGTKSTATNAEIEAYSTKGSVEVVVFTAPWCGPCHRFVRELNAIYDNSFDADLFKRIKNTAYVTTSKDSTLPPTQHDIDEESEKFGRRFTVKPDPEYKIYGTYYKQAVKQIPAIVLIPDGKNPKVFPLNPAATAAQVSTFLKAILR